MGLNPAVRAEVRGYTARYARVPFRCTRYSSTNRRWDGVSGAVAGPADAWWAYARGWLAEDRKET